MSGLQEGGFRPALMSRKVERGMERVTLTDIFSFLFALEEGRGMNGHGSSVGISLSSGKPLKRSLSFSWGITSYIGACKAL